MTKSGCSIRGRLVPERRGTIGSSVKPTARYLNPATTMPVTAKGEYRMKIQEENKEMEAGSTKEILLGIYERLGDLLVAMS